MSQVTVAQLAEVLGVSIDKLLDQLNKAGIEAASGDDAVSNDDKKKNIIDQCSPEEETHIRSVVASLAWVARQVRIDQSYIVSRLQSMTREQL